MQVEDKMVNLAPGMAVTVEIKTGTRGLIECPMPLLRCRQKVYGRDEKVFLGWMHTILGRISKT